MSDPMPATTDKISEAIEKLRRLTRLNIQGDWGFWEGDLAIAPLEELDCWSIAKLNERGHIAWSSGQQVLWLRQRIVVPHNLHGYPLDGLCLRVGLTWWAQAASIFVNGELVQAGDLFDSSARVVLKQAAIPGEEIILALRLVSPGHDAGALMRSLLLWESADPTCLDPGFVADELETLHNLIRVKNSQDLCTNILLSSPAVVKEKNLDSLIKLIDWDALADKAKFERSLFAFRQSLLEGDGEDGADGEELFVNLRTKFSNSKLVGGAVVEPEIVEAIVPARETPLQNQLAPALPIQTTIPSSLKQFQIHLLGHAHLDLAWLWPVSETWEVAQRTFESALQLLQEFPDLIFCHSTPALYAWIEKHRPDLFENIKQQVAAGRWEIVGGTWVEPELNLISGESIVRQVLYGQRYAREKFGELMRVAWLPDTFGFCWQLPQIFKQGGIAYFVTQKLSWNDTTEFPHSVFWWQSPDGSKILSLMSAPIGEGIEAVKMASYAYDWEAKTGLRDALWLPGVGDHGGGPTRDMLEVAKRWQQSPFFPELKFTKAVDYLSSICGELSDELSEVHPRDRTNTPLPIPVWNDELYFEFHRGCYTSHADQKRWNRRCEGLLYEAELLAALATLSAGLVYPQAELETAWKQVLFNQFHDILPGSSIGEVYVEANQGWAEVERVGEEILTAAMDAIASQITLPPPPHPQAQPILIFNTLNWSRSEVVALPLPTSPQFLREVGADMHWQICDLSGERLTSQLSNPEHDSQATLLFLATEIPPVGYRLFWLYPQAVGTLENASSEEESQKKVKLPQVTPVILARDRDFEQKKYFEAKDWILENEFIRVKVESNTGNLSSIFDKADSREILNQGGGNQLQSFQDSGQYWDAWNIDPNYAEHPLPTPILKDIRWIEQGKIQQRLRVVRQIGESEFCQDYILQESSRVLKISTIVDWQERHVLVKVAFSLNLETEAVTYEIPCGAIERKTRLSAEQNPPFAKWEVPALRWADISVGGYGVSLLNDCKYGYDAQSNQLRLTLLRGSTWPDEAADRGIHQFTYGIYPHGGSWQDAQTVRRGYELNLPLKVKVLPIGEEGVKSLPSVGKFLDLSGENLVLMAFKQSEDDGNIWILRCYECCGGEERLELKSDLGLAIVQSVDLLEEGEDEELTAKIQREEQKGINCLGDGQAFEIAPWKIVSFAVVKS
ncbi:alpha-mannosidase [Kamptonema animale CS-326]|jgi:alpha-mannosidase|uniref:alpha-mannosidase n=1 Tax=Kamptonema animale TaxID=92934 RepID=UPI00232C0E0D|nr:alpha-mannosidase [Kamptonema animale]MDB9512520.1 alpha-mannosidase [Kamptonema animale CS-326]